tara:strand:- start:74 stop:1027 length:954 start_codon:yes stop_codon:yes gene_type:complete
MPKEYRRIMLGAHSKHADLMYEGRFVGAGYGFRESLENDLVDNWREFNKKHIPIWLNNNPGKSKVAAGLACGSLHTICKGMKIDDIVLCPDGHGNYYLGKVTSDYYFVGDERLKDDEYYSHRRKVEWFDKKIARSDMSDALKNSAGSANAVSNVTKYAEEIENHLSGQVINQIFSRDDSIEDPSTFALENHLEDFLVKNWSNTILSEKYDIVEEDGQKVGQQFQTDTGPIDILAISKDRKEFLVIELKRGRASDAVVGQIMRYMGFVKSEIVSDDQTVKGCIIALDDDIRIKNALKMSDDIAFYKYKIQFDLIKDND